MWILACIPWGGTSGPPERERGRPSPVQPAALAQNSDSISDSDTMQLFVLQVLTLSQLQKKRGGIVIVTINSMKQFERLSGGEEL